MLDSSWRISAANRDLIGMEHYNIANNDLF